MLLRRENLILIDMEPIHDLKEAQLRVSFRVRVNRKGEVTIPLELLSKLGIEEGDFLNAKAANGAIVLTPLPPFEPGEPVGEEEHKRIIEELERRRRNWR